MPVFQKEKKLLHAFPGDALALQPHEDGVPDFLRPQRPRYRIDGLAYDPENLVGVFSLFVGKAPICGNLAAAVIDVIADRPPFGIGFDVLLEFKNSIRGCAGFFVPRAGAGRLSLFNSELFNPGFEAQAVRSGLSGKQRGALFGNLDRMAHS